MVGLVAWAGHVQPSDPRAPTVHGGHARPRAAAPPRRRRRRSTAEARAASGSRAQRPHHDAAHTSRRPRLQLQGALSPRCRADGRGRGAKCRSGECGAVWRMRCNGGGVQQSRCGTGGPRGANSCAQPLRARAARGSPVAACAPACSPRLRAYNQWAQPEIGPSPTSACPPRRAHTTTRTAATPRALPQYHAHCHCRNTTRTAATPRRRPWCSVQAAAATARVTTWTRGA